MDTKTYNVIVKSLKKEDNNSTLSLEVLRGRKKVATSIIEQEIDYTSLVFTDSYHSFSQHIDTTDEQWYLTMTTIPKYRVSSMLKDASYTFSECSSVIEIDATPFANAKLTDMSNMFSWCEALKYVNLTNVDTSKVKDFSNIFMYCRVLNKIDGVFDLSGIEEGRIGMLNNMFLECPSTLKVKFRNVPSNFFDKIKTSYDSWELTAPERMGLKPEQVEIIS